MTAWAEQRSLTEDWLDISNWCGDGRYAYALAHGLRPKGASANIRNSSYHRVGARCECCAGLQLKLTWDANTEYRKGQRDVGGIIEVRSTVLVTGSLIVHPEETGPFVLVVELNERDHVLPGWLDAEIAKQFPLKTYHDDPAHYVPQQALLPLDALRAIIPQLLDARAAA